MEASAYPFLELLQGKLAIISTPPDQCTRLKVEHVAPDGSTVTKEIYLHMVGKFEGTVEQCLPTNGNCQPNIENLVLKSTAGQITTIVLFEQDTVESYFRACEGSLFYLTGAPFWLSLSDSFSLVINAPNDVNIPGKYNFFVGIWEVTLEVDAPCSSNYLQGL